MAALSSYPQLNRTGPTPIYAQIKTWMRAQIMSGSWPDNYKLLAEADLATELDVSRGTIRKAIAELTDEGLLERTHGRGTFVTPTLLQQPLADRMVTFSEDLISKGIPFETQVLSQEIVPAGSRLGPILSVDEEASLFFLRRLRSIDDEPIILVNSFVVNDIAPGLGHLDYTTQRLFPAIEERAQMFIKNGSRTFQARLADSHTARMLDISRRSAVMYMEQISYLGDGRPVEFSELWLRGDRFQLTAFVERSHFESGVMVTVVNGRKSIPEPALT
ncbi:MAG: GntR family transcriptional regulator [Caldilineales bacterium]|nr:GntR family transcriptional regulator [Caldilineales bacterium]